MSNKYPQYEVQEFGGFGGNSFESQYPSRIGLYHGTWVSALLLNGQQFGGVSNPSKTLVLGPDEYINSVSVTWGRFVGSLRFGTNRGRSISGGTPAPNTAELHDVRVISIGGRSGAYLDNISIDYVLNYSPSTIIERAPVIVGLIPPGTTYYHETTSFAKSVETYKLTSQLDITMNMSISAKLEYVSGLNYRTDLNIKSTNIEEISRALENSLTNTNKTTFESGSNYAFIVCTCDILLDQTGGTFIIPREDTIILSPTKDEYHTLVGAYTMIQAVTQVTGLTSVERNGLRFLDGDG